jgi:hypothetical protein
VALFIYLFIYFIYLFIYYLWGSPEHHPYIIMAPITTHSTSPGMPPMTSPARHTDSASTENELSRTENDMGSTKMTSPEGENDLGSTEIVPHAEPIIRVWLPSAYPFNITANGEVGSRAPLLGTRV